MKSSLKIAAVFGTVFSLLGSAAAAPCKPVAPADIEGGFTFAHPQGASVAAEYFTQNACDWGDREDLNGLDAVALDVESVGGTAGNMIASVGNGTTGTAGTVTISVDGRFYDSSCALMEGSEINQSTNGQPYSLEIPAGAKWMLITAAGNYPSRDVGVILHSDGIICKPKKKKP